MNFTKIALAVVLLFANFLISKPLSAQCTTGDCQNGYGKMQYGKDGQYVGQFKDGKKNGIGTLTGKKGEVYIGGFMDDKKYGRGVLAKNQKIEKDGYWLNDKFIKVKDPDMEDYKLTGNCENGTGIYIFKNGDSYTCQWKEGKKNGMGIIYFKGAGTYIGNFSNDQRNGFGVMQWVETGRYEGQWKDGQMDGDGVFYNPDQTVRQKGKWANGVFQALAAPPTIKVGDTTIIDNFNNKIQLLLADSRNQFHLLKGDKVAGGIITSDYMSKLKLFPDADDEIDHTDMDANGKESHFEYKTVKYGAANAKQKIDDLHTQIKASLQGNWQDAKLPSGYGYEMINNGTNTHIIIRSNETNDVSVEFFSK